MKNKLRIAIVLAITVLNLNSQTKKIIKEAPKQVNNCYTLQKENDSLKKTLDLNTPITTINSNDFDFKLTKVRGDLKTQLVTFEILITNNSINRKLSIIKEKSNIVTMEGDALQIKNYKLPASGTDHVMMIFELSKNIPTKCTFTFGEILPTSIYIKLFKLNYLMKELQETIEFNDLKIDWK